MELTPADHTAELRRLSGLLDKALAYLSTKAAEWASAENELRRAQATQYAIAKHHEKTEAARRQYVTDHTLDEAQAADMAEAMKNAATLAVKARIAQLSAGQSVGNVLKEEMRMSGRYAG